MAVSITLKLHKSSSFIESTFIGKFRLSNDAYTRTDRERISKIGVSFISGTKKWTIIILSSGALFGLAGRKRRRYQNTRDNYASERLRKFPWYWTGTGKATDDRGAASTVAGEIALKSCAQVRSKDRSSLLLFFYFYGGVDRSLLEVL